MPFASRQLKNASRASQHRSRWLRFGAMVSAEVGLAVVDSSERENHPMVFVAGEVTAFSGDNKMAASFGIARWRYQ